MMFVCVDAPLPRTIKKPNELPIVVIQKPAQPLFDLHGRVKIALCDRLYPNTIWPELTVWNQAKAPRIWQWADRPT